MCPAPPQALTGAMNWSEKVANFARKKIRADLTGNHVTVWSLTGNQGTASVIISVPVMETAALMLNSLILNYSAETMAALSAGL